MIRYNSRKEKYKRPFGAVRQGETIRIRLEAKRNAGIYKPMLNLFKDGSWSPKSYMMEFTSLNGDVETYSLNFEIESEGLYWYNFSCFLDDEIVYFGKGEDDLIAAGSTESWQLTVYSAEYKTPDWLKGGIMYQIFPDRFFRSTSYEPVVREDCKLREDWGGIPEHMVYPDGSVPNNDFFGGNLEGVIEKLPYLKKLNVNCIYFNPIFEAASNHKYDTGDYEKIDGMFGNEDVFKRLCIEADKMGIKIILDGVFNHTGSDSKYFNKEGRYPSLGAYQSVDSPYFSWYDFTKWPDEYSSWWGVTILPQVKEEEPSYLDYITGDNGILAKWIKAGAMGYRLDVADELPDVFLDALRKRVKKENSQAVIIGEVWEDASNKISYGQRRRYLEGAQLDSVMNYVFKNAIIEYIKGGSAKQFAEIINSVLENYPWESICVLMNILGTHDTKRILTELGTKKKLKAAAVLQYFLPGVPCVYYGDEAGLSGEGDPYCRGCFPWDDEDEDLLNFYIQLGKIRSQNDEILRTGKCFTNYVNEDIIYLERVCADESLYIIINRSESAKEIDLSAIGITLLDNNDFIDLFNGKMLTNHLTIEGNGTIAFKKKVGG